MTAAIEVTGASLTYRLLTSPVGSVKDYALTAARGRIKYRDVGALTDLDFHVHPGEVVAVVGRNGAGKSSLMKLLARVLPPTAGRVVVRGRVAPMIELGAGFNADLTGRENALLYGALLGREPSFMTARMEHIIEWAGIPDFIDAPVRSYSSGMVARLAFSVAVDLEPDVLLVDEVLSVGDEGFQARSSDRMDGLIRSGACVVLVSHNLRQVEERADRVVWLERGRVRRTGAAAEVIQEYREWSRQEEAGA